MTSQPSAFRSSSGLVQRDDARAQPWLDPAPALKRRPPGPLPEPLTDEHHRIVRRHDRSDGPLRHGVHSEPSLKAGIDRRPLGDLAC